MDSSRPRDDLAAPLGAPRSHQATAVEAALPHAPHATVPVPSYAPPQAPVLDERRVLAIVGETRRVGRWTVPRRLRVRAFLGEVTVDLRENAIPEGFVFDVRVYGGRVTLIVPPDTPVVFDVFAALGNAINQADEPTASDGGSSRVVRVTGSAVLGEVRVLVRAPVRDPAM
jgi:hypothetical protein